MKTTHDWSAADALTAEQVHAAALAEVVDKEKGATDGFKAAVAALGQDCKGCHDAYKLK